MRRLVELRRDWGRLGSAVARDELPMLLGTFGHRPCGAGPVVCVCVCGAGVALSFLGGAQVVSVVGRLERGLIACGDLRGFDFVWLGICFAWAKRGRSNCVLHPLGGFRPPPAGLEVRGFEPLAFSLRTRRSTN